MLAIPGITVDSFFDIETLYAGTNMALSYIIGHLTKYVAFHFADNQNRKLADNVIDDLLYYQIPDILIVHCIEGASTLQNATLETLLNLCTFQNAKDTLVVKNSWLKAWFGEFDLPEKKVQVISNGINIVEPIGKPLAKQHTAALFDKPIFAQQPVVGLISGFEPNYGGKMISAFARANPHLAIFVYNPFLAEHYTNPPSNVVIFSADDDRRTPKSCLPPYKIANMRSTS